MNAVATRTELLQSKRDLLRAMAKARAESSFASFCVQAWDILEPATPLVWNWHLDTICGYLEAFFRKDIKRLIINVPPGSMKSLLFSVFGPAWCWTWAPGERFINLTNEIGLATRDSLRMRQVIQSDWYQGNWGDKVQIAPDQREKMHFANTRGGFRQGLGITGNITGKRGSFLLIDDPTDAQKAFSDVEIKTVNDTYDNAVSSRLNDPVNDCIGLIMQRLRTNDLTGHLQAKKEQEWITVAIPMEYDGPRFDAGRDLGRPDLNDPRTQIGELMFPSRFPRKAVAALQEDLGDYGVAGQHQQRPAPLGGGILKAQWWRKWPKDKPLPYCEHIFCSWDTAYSEADMKAAAYSAMTKWGIWWDEQTNRHEVLLLGAWDDRVDYPDLEEMALSIDKEDGPDRHLIEKKASGISLVQSLRRRKISVYPYSPDRDKIARAYATQSMLKSGQVWYPEGRKWASRVVDQVATFPTGAPPSADYTDTCTQAWLYLRNHWWISGHPDDDEDETPPPQTTRDKVVRLYG